MFSTKKTFNDNAADRRAGDMAGVAANPVKDASAGRNRDAMGATLLLDCLFGGMINEGLSEALDLPAGMDDLDVITTIELYDEFWNDRQSGLAARERRNLKKSQSANGGFELGDKSVLRGGFNMSVTPRAMKGGWDLVLPGDRKAAERDLQRFFDSAPSAGTTGQGGFTAVLAGFSAKSGGPAMTP